MCITEEKLVDRYGESDPHERFMLIYKNYEVFLRLVESYETGFLIPAEKQRRWGWMLHFPLKCGATDTNFLRMKKSWKN